MHTKSDITSLHTSFYDHWVANRFFSSCCISYHTKNTHQTTWNTLNSSLIQNFQNIGWNQHLECTHIYDIVTLNSSSLWTWEMNHRNNKVRAISYLVEESSSITCLSHSAFRRILNVNMWIDHFKSANDGGNLWPPAIWGSRPFS
jgi:hypothetical protein